MIISRKHIHSMAYISNNEMNELLNLIKLLREIISKKFNTQPILFEHGSAIGCFNKSANSVDHAHLHIIPIHMKKEIEIIRDSRANRIPNFQTITSFKDEPYFLYVNNDCQHYLSHDFELPRQYMRKWIAREVNRPQEWDWRHYEFIDNIKITIDFFKEIHMAF